MELEKTYTTFEDRAIDELVHGADCLRSIFGDDYHFHDAELDSIHIESDGKVVLEIWDYEWTSKDDYIITMTLENTHSAEMYNYDPHTCYIYEINFTKEKYHGWLQVVIDGVGVNFICDSATFSIRPLPKSSDDPESIDEGVL